MKKLFVLAAEALALAAAGAAFADDGDRVSQELSLSGFDAITVGGVYELDVRVGGDYSIRLSGPQNEMDLIDVSVKNGALVLSQKENKKSFNNRNRKGVEAVVTMPSLKGVNISGVVEGKIAGVDADSFAVGVSGVGDLSIEGECGALEANLSGVGDLDAEHLECAKVDVNVSGVGSAAVFARDEVVAKVSGMGDIDVYGSPKTVHKNKGMFADITVH